jgi:glycine betaine/proline transport system substrate-binding protein
MKKGLLSLAVTLGFTLSSGAAFSAEKVNIGTPAWTGAQAIAALLQAVVVERIGGEANLVPGTQPGKFHQKVC